MKPGWQTSEFWMTIAANVVAILAALGVIGPHDRPGVEGALQQAIIAIAGFAAAAATLWRYISGRVALKSEEVRAQVKVLTESTPVSK